jgi:hypothetical protein
VNNNPAYIQQRDVKKYSNLRLPHVRRDTDIYAPVPPARKFEILIYVIDKYIFVVLRQWVQPADQVPEKPPRSGPGDSGYPLFACQAGR